jgi:hypothetical protein
MRRGVARVARCAPECYVDLAEPSILAEIVSDRWMVSTEYTRRLRRGNARGNASDGGTSP